jgi:opacity protein-like surface antigen
MNANDEEAELQVIGICGLFMCGEQQLVAIGVLTIAGGLRDRAGNRKVDAPRQIEVRTRCGRHSPYYEMGFRSQSNVDLEAQEMKKFLAALLLVSAAAAVSGVAHAQGTPAIELFGGYSYARLDAPGIAPPYSLITSGNQGGNGYHFAAQANFTSWLGIYGDFAGYYASPTVNGGLVGLPTQVKANESAYPFLFGPQLSFRKLRPATLFAHALIGGMHENANVPGGFGAETGTKYAYGFGAGVDVKVARILAVRVVQADYIRSHFPTSDTVNAQNNWRISTGIVFRGGSRP